MKRSYSLIIRRNSGPAANTSSSETKNSNSAFVIRRARQQPLSPKAKPAPPLAIYFQDSRDPYGSLPGSPVSRQSKSLTHTSGPNHMLGVSSSSGGIFNSNAAAKTIRICVLGAPRVGKTGKVHTSSSQTTQAVTFFALYKARGQRLHHLAKAREGKCSVLPEKALVVRFLTGRFIWEYSSIERVYIHQARSGLLDTDDSSGGGEIVWMEIRDCNDLLTSQKGADERKTSTSSQFCPVPPADGYLLVFAIDDAESFQALAGILPRIPIPAPCILVENKHDLEHFRAVELESIKDLTEQWNLHFMEASAREDRESAENIFAKISREILGKRTVKKRKPSQRIFESLNKMLGQIVQK